jgi:DNA-binding transcriptional LysR family regulator
MELRHLRAFAAAAERESFTRAAQIVGLTQAAVSQQIAFLSQRVNRHEIGLARIKVRGFRPRRQLYMINDPRHIPATPAREFLEFVEQWRAEHGTM